jgi:hypothetical protein
MTPRLLLAPLVFAVSVSGQSPTFREGEFQGRRAYILETSRMRVSALAGGGHLAEIRLKTGDPRKDVNPMRVPHYPTIEPHEYDPARHDALYGTDPHRWLSSGYMGHLLCFPQFGPPSADEAAAGLGNHGEAPIVEWKRQWSEARAGQVRLRYGAELPKTQYRVWRTLTLREGELALEVEEWVENLASMDRPINWVQHATFGPPFIAPGASYLDISPIKAVAGGAAVPRGFTGKPATGGYTAMLLDAASATSWFTVYNPEYRVLIGYVFPTADNPWIADWQENQRTRSKPWDGKVIARGIEFGTTPLAEGLRKSVERATMLGAPTYRWIGARQALRTSFTVLLQEIPEGFPGVAALEWKDGRALIRERQQ